MRRLWLGLFLSTLVGLAGCGGSPSKSGFVKDADDACRTANAPVASAKAPTSFPELVDGARNLTAATDTQLPQLRELDRPAGDAARIDIVFEALSGVARAARSLQTAAEHKDEKATAQATNDLTARAKEAGDGARAYGFTACGVSTQTATTPLADGAKRIIKAGFLARAEGLCREASRRIGGIPEPTSRSSELRAFGAFLPIAEKLQADTRALVAPPGDEATVNEILDTQQKVIDKIGEYVDALRDNDSRRISEIEDATDVLNTAVNAKWDAYGIRACGTDF